MEKIKVMGVSYFLACRLKAQHLDSGQKRPIDLLFLPDHLGMPIEAFTYDRTNEPLATRHPVLLPADNLLLNSEYRFNQANRRVFLTISELVGMIEHRLKLPHFRQQSLDRAVECVVSLFYTNAIDLDDFVDSLIGTPRLLLKRLPELQTLVGQALRYRLAWRDPKNQATLAKHVAIALQRGLQEFWSDRVAIPL